MGDFAFKKEILGAKNVKKASTRHRRGRKFHCLLLYTNLSDVTEIYLQT